MTPITYKIVGGITFISGILFFINWISSIGTGADGLWFPFCASIVLLATGILYILFGTGKLKINKISNKSLGTIISAFIVAIGGFSLTWLYLVFTNADPMGMIFALGFVYLGAIIALIAFILLIIAILKNRC